MTSGSLKVANPCTSAGPQRVATTVNDREQALKDDPYCVGLLELLKLLLRMRWLRDLKVRGGP